MYSDLNVFRLAHAMAAHAGHRQSIVAQNVANADTPGYRAKDLQPFFEIAGSASSHPMRATHGRHLASPAHLPAGREHISSDATADPNGNSVSVELEMMKAVNIKQQHDRALAIYRSSMNILRATLRQ